jgi:hypothetical protein
MHEREICTRTHGRLTHEHESLDLGAVLAKAAMEEHMDLDGARL